MLKKLTDSAILMTWVKDFVRFGVPFLIVPLILKFYNDAEQTFYFFIGTISAFVTVLEGGVSTTVIRAISYFNQGADKIPKNRAEFDAAGEIEDTGTNFNRMIELFHTSRWIYMILTVSAVIALSTAGVAAVWNFIEQTDHRPDLWGAYGFLVLYFAIYMSNIRWSSFMRGLDFVAAEAKFNTITTAVRITVWAIMLSFRMKPIALCIALSGEAVVSHLYLRFYISRWFRRNNVTLKRKGSFSVQLFKSLWPATWRQAGINMGNFMVERGNNIIILQTSDTTLMANFTFTTWVLRTIFSFSLTPIYSRLPVLYKLAAEKNFKKLRESAAGYMFLGLTMITVAYVLIGGAGNPLLEILNSDRRFIFPVALFAVMALTEILDIHASYHAGVYTSTNHIPFFWPSIISGAIIFTVGLYYALPVYGLVGIIMTRFLVQLCFNNWYAVFLNMRLLNWSVWSYLVDLPRYGYSFVIDKIRDVVPFLNKK